MTTHAHAHDHSQDIVATLDKFPRHAAQVYQVYQDLRFARHWHAVRLVVPPPPPPPPPPISSSLTTDRAQVLVEAQFADHPRSPWHRMLAWPLDLALDFALFDSYAFPLVLAICSNDSTVVYYHLHKGIHLDPIPPLAALMPTPPASSSDQPQQ